MQDNSGSINKRLNVLLANSKNKSYFIGAVTVLFIILMVMMGILPAYSAFTFQQEENSKRDDLITRLQAKLDLSKNLTQEYTNKQQIINYFNKVFPSTPNQEDVIDYLNNLAKSDKIFLDKISFAAVDPTQVAQLKLEQLISAQSMSISVQGDQENLLTFTHDIENSSRIFNILSLSMSSKSEDELTTSGTNGSHDLNIQVQYYYLPKST